MHVDALQASLASRPSRSHRVGEGADRPAPEWRPRPAAWPGALDVVCDNAGFAGVVADAWLVWPPSSVGCSVLRPRAQRETVGAPRTCAASLHSTCRVSAIARTRRTGACSTRSGTPGWPRGSHPCRDASGPKSPRMRHPPRLRSAKHGESGRQSKISRHPPRLRSARHGESGPKSPRMRHRPRLRSASVSTPRIQPPGRGRRPPVAMLSPRVRSAAESVVTDLAHGARRRTGTDRRPFFGITPAPGPRVQPRLLLRTPLPGQPAPSRRKACRGFAATR